MKKALWIATVLLVAGILIGVVTLALVDFDFSKLDTDKYVSTTHEINDTFGDIQIFSDISNIHFALSEDDTCRVTTRVKENMACTVTVKDNALVIREKDCRKWYQHIGFNLTKGDITVYLPQSLYINLTVKTDTGDITVPENFIFDDVHLVTDTGNIHYYGILLDDLAAESDTGDIYLQNIHTPGDINLETDTGDIFLTNVRCGELEIDSDTGGVKLHLCDPDNADIETDTGDVNGSLLSSKIFLVNSSTGEIIVPETVSGGKCKIKTNTGDIHITIE